MLEKYFRLVENKTNIKTEIIAGNTTFMTMAFILSALVVIRYIFLSE